MTIKARPCNLINKISIYKVNNKGDTTAPGTYGRSLLDGGPCYEH